MITDDDIPFIEAAIARAELSVPEDDGSRPKVGAVLVLSGVVLGIAHRGECRPGEHAELCLFVHKLEHADLTGATLYTTLEPCLGCCIEQVVKRGIRRVVIGSMDPHPFVCARSLRRLHAASIPVDLFPMKYMVRINEQNSSFNTHRGKDPFDGRMSSG